MDTIHFVMFDKYKKNIFSQSGEDGVIFELLRRIRLKKKANSRHRGNGRARGKNARFLCGAKKAFETESAPAGAAVIALHTDMSKGVPRSGPMWECSVMSGGGASPKSVKKLNTEIARIA